MSTHYSKAICTKVFAKEASSQPWRHFAYRACLATHHKRFRDRITLAHKAPHYQPKACYLASHPQQKGSQRSQTRWHARTYVIGSLIVGGLLLAQYKRADNAKAAYSSIALPKQVSTSLLWEDIALLKRTLSDANTDNLSVYFDLAEGIVQDAERMIEAARLTAMYLNDYINEDRIDSYESIQDKTLAITKKLANNYNVAYPAFVDNFAKKIKVKQKGNDYLLLIEAYGAVAQGITDVFIELPGNILSCIKLIAIDLPVWLLSGTMEIKAMADFESDFLKLKRESDDFLTHYNTLSDKALSPLHGIALLQKATALNGKIEEIIKSALKKQGASIFLPPPFNAVPLVMSMIELAQLDPAAFKKRSNDIATIIANLRSELGLLRYYPDIATRGQKWWGDKSDREKFRTIGRGIGEGILFFYGGDILEELLEGTVQVGSKMKNVLDKLKNLCKGSKVQKSIRITELLEEGGVCFSKASKLLARGDKVRKVVVSLEELAQFSKVANAAEKIKMVEIAVEAGKLSNVRKITQLTETLTESFKTLKGGTEVCISVINREGSITKILSTGVCHGNEAHWATMWNNALKLAESGEYSHVFLNKWLGTSAKFSDVRIPSGIMKNRPDIWALGKKGKNNCLIEVISPSQAKGAALNKLTNKTKRVVECLNNIGGGEINWSTISPGTFFGFSK